MHTAAHLSQATPISFCAVTTKEVVSREKQLSRRNGESCIIEGVAPSNLRLCLLLRLRRCTAMTGFDRRKRPAPDQKPSKHGASKLNYDDTLAHSRICSFRKRRLTVWDRSPQRNLAIRALCCHCRSAYNIAQAFQGHAHAQYRKCPVRKHACMHTDGGGSRLGGWMVVRTVSGGPCESRRLQRKIPRKPPSIAKCPDIHITRSPFSPLTSLQTDYRRGKHNTQCQATSANIPVNTASNAPNMKREGGGFSLLPPPDRGKLF